MIAAASANGSGQTSAWYPTQNYVGYYGLGGVQRVGAALNGYLGSPYSGKFVKSVNYLIFTYIYVKVFIPIKLSIIIMRLLPPFLGVIMQQLHHQQKH